MTQHSGRQLLSFSIKLYKIKSENDDIFSLSGAIENSWQNAQEMTVEGKNAEPKKYFIQCEI